MSSKRWISRCCLSCCLQLFVLRTDASCDYPSRPSHCLAENPQLYTRSVRCPGFSDVSSVQCSYKLGLRADPIPTVSLCSHFPGKPFDLRWSVYTYRSSSTCLPMFNFTWWLPQDGSFDFLTGFALRMNYVNTNHQYIRMFNISSLHPVDLGKTQFYYDCFPVTSHIQRITVVSLPSSPSAAKLPNHSVMIVKTDALDDHNADKVCNESWIPRATVIPSEFDANVNVSFDPAPDCYHFSAYSVSLVDDNSGPLNIIIQRLTLHHPRNTEKLQYLFTDVCPGEIVISVMIRPFINDSCGCVSATSALSIFSVTAAPAAETCVQCLVTKIGPIDMSRSRCKNSEPSTIDVEPTCPPITPSPTAATTTVQIISHPEQKTAHAAGVLGAATVGVLVAIFLVVLIAAVMYNVRHRRTTTADSPIHTSSELVSADSWRSSSGSTTSIDHQVRRFNNDFDHDALTSLTAASARSVKSCSAAYR